MAGAKCHLAGGVRRLIGSKITDLRRLLDFLTNSSSGTLSLQLENHEISSFSFKDLNIPPDLLQDLWELVSSLSVITEQSDRDILFPDTTKVQVNDFREMDRIANLIKRGYALTERDELEFGTIGSFEVPELPILLCYYRKLELNLMSETYDLGFESFYYIAESLEQRSESKHAVIFKAGETYGNSLIHRFTPKNEINPKVIDQLLYTCVPDIESWKQEIEKLPASTFGITSV